MVSGTIFIDAQQTEQPYVDRGVLGGNSVLDRVADYADPVYAEMGANATPSGTRLNRPLWRMMMEDEGDHRNLWFYHPDLRRRSNGLYNPMINESDPEFNWQAQYPIVNIDLSSPVKADGSASDNDYRIGWFDRSPSFSAQLNQHAIGYAKAPGSTLQVNRIFPPAYLSLNQLPNGPLFFRFDFKLLSDRPFSIATKALVGKTGPYRVYLLPNKSLQIGIGYPDYAQTITTAPLSLDQWYSVETQTGTPSRLWLNGQLVGQVAGSNSTTTAALTPEVDFGTLSDSAPAPAITASSQGNDSYLYEIDEFVVQTTYSGAFPQTPNHPILWHRFDSSVLTLDDYGAIAEKLNLELLPQLPAPCEIQYGCTQDALSGFFKNFTSVAGLTAMIQYFVGAADPNYAAGAQAIAAAGWPLTDLKLADGTGTYNYADLRASRGRIAPYPLQYVELGNEPYYTDYKHNEAGFAKRFTDLCESIHTIKPSLRCVLPTQSSSAFDMDAVMQYLVSHGKQNLVAGLAVHDYFQYPGFDPVNDYPLRTMSAGYADSFRFVQAQRLALQYLGHAPGDPNFSIFIDEYNRILANFKYTLTDRFIDSAYQASEIAFMLEHGVNGGSLFFWNAGSLGERFTTGLTGDYPGGPQINLNGRTFQAFSRNFGWGGKMVPVVYDSLTVHENVTNTNVPRLTAISSLSADGKRLFVAVINRDTAPHAETIQLKNFNPNPSATVYALVANALNDSLAQTDYHASAVQAAAAFSYSFPAYSITFLTFDATAG